MPEQWLNPATWSGAQWLVVAILVLAVLALAVVIYWFIGVVQSEMTRKRQRPVLRPSLRPDLQPSRHGETEEPAAPEQPASPDRNQ